MRWPWRKQSDDYGRWIPTRPDRNPVHDYMYPDCNRPIPHGHDLDLIFPDDQPDAQQVITERNTETRS